MKKEFGNALLSGDQTPVVLNGLTEDPITNGTTEEHIISLEVAEMVGKQHNELLKDIRRYSSQLAEGNIPQGVFFIESIYKDSNKQDRPCYLVTRKGCEFIAHKLTGKKGTMFTAKYIEKFHEMHEHIQKYAGLSKELQAIFTIDEKQQKLESRIDALEDNIIISRAQQKQLKQFASKVVVSALGSRHSPAYKELAGKAFSHFWRDYYNHFNVSSYLDTPRKDFQAALQFINDWAPDKELRYMILGANTGADLNENFKEI